MCVFLYTMYGLSQQRQITRVLLYLQFIPVFYFPICPVSILYILSKAIQYVSRYMISVSSIPGSYISFLYSYSCH